MPVVGMGIKLQTQSPFFLLVTLNLSTSRSLYNICQYKARKFHSKGTKKGTLFSFYSQFSYLQSYCLKEQKAHGMFDIISNNNSTFDHKQ